MYEKAKQFDKAAMYYGRAVRGLREIYIAFHWNGDPAANAPGKYSREYVQIPKEMDERYRKCLGLAGLRPQRCALAGSRACGRPGSGGWPISTTCG